MREQQRWLPEQPIPQAIRRKLLRFFSSNSYWKWPKN